MDDEYIEGYNDGMYDASIIFLEELYNAPFLKRVWACVIILFNNKNKVELFKKASNSEVKDEISNN